MGKAESRINQSLNQESLGIAQSVFLYILNISEHILCDFEGREIQRNFLVPDKIAFILRNSPDY